MRLLVPALKFSWNVFLLFSFSFLTYCIRFKVGQLQFNIVSFHHLNCQTCLPNWQSAYWRYWIFRYCLNFQEEIMSPEIISSLISSCFRLLRHLKFRDFWIRDSKTCKALRFVPVTETLASTENTEKLEEPTVSEWDHGATCLILRGFWHHLRYCELITLTVRRII